MAYKRFLVKTLSHWSNNDDMTDIVADYDTIDECLAYIRDNQNAPCVDYYEVRDQVENIVIDIGQLAENKGE